MKDISKINYGFQILLGVQIVLSKYEDDQLLINYFSDITSSMKFSLIPFVDVERFFSLYKNILSYMITHITPENM